MKTLLIEDNPVNLDVQTRMLTKLGLDVVTAPGGKEGLEQFINGNFPLVFVDWQMPEMDGIETASRIRDISRNPRPVLVALSGHALPGDREELLSKGFDDYLSKPLRLQDFRDVLGRWFPDET